MDIFNLSLGIINLVVVAWLISGYTKDSPPYIIAIIVFNAMMGITNVVGYFI